MEYYELLQKRKSNAENIKNSIFRGLNSLDKFAKENIKKEEINFLGMVEDSIKDMKSDVKDLIERMFYIIQLDEKPKPPKIII
jgi:plasmid replication initiation protein